MCLVIACTNQIISQEAKTLFCNICKNKFIKNKMIYYSVQLLCLRNYLLHINYVINEKRMFRITHT